ncbi:MAG: BT_3928 family protein, partial [Bacteroidota bacterium]
FNRILSFLVGGLFIFSGLIKCNDPKGTQIKLEEYFQVFSSDISSFFEVFIPYALPIAVFIVVLEVALGVALIIGFKQRTVNKLLLLMILFFTFLTFYTAYFNKVTDCGCFGDAIKLTPWESFTKDVILLVMIVILWVQGKKIPNKASFLSTTVTLLGTVGAIYVAMTAINHLPFIDFRPYAPGKSIVQQMNAEEPCQTEYVVLRGEEEIRSTEWREDFTKKEMRVKEVEETYMRLDSVTQDSVEMIRMRLDTSFKSVKNYDSMYTNILNEDKCMAVISDYGIYSYEGDDYTQASLEGYDLILVVHNVKKTEKASFEELKRFMDDLASEKTLARAIFTSESPDVFEEFRHEAQLDIPYYLGDEKMLKTMIRSNPGLLLLKDGVVLDKWHYNDIPSPDVIRTLIGE